MTTVKTSEDLGKALDQKKKQKISQSYLVRSFGQNIKKLKETGLITDDEEKELRVIHKKVMTNYINASLM